MATDNNGEGAAGSRVVLQRARPSRSRQVRTVRTPGAAVGVPAAAPEGKEAGQRRIARVRQARTVMQRRPENARFTQFPIDIDIDIVIKMALRSNARRLQSRQLSVQRLPSLPVSGAVALPPVVKLDVARVAQGRQISATRLSARPAGTKK